MKGLIVLLLIVGLAYGCAGQVPSVCDNQADSVLCEVATEHGVRLETVGDILMVVNLRAIKQGAYTKSQARDALISMKDAYHAAGFTSADLKALVLKYVDEYPELILVVSYAGYFDAPEVLKPADIEILDCYIDQQIGLME